MVCLRNICINTLHKGDYDGDNNNNNNNNIINGKHVRFRASILVLTKKKIRILVTDLHGRTTASLVTEIRTALVTSRGVNETFVLLECHAALICSY